MPSFSVFFGRTVGDARTPVEAARVALERHQEAVGGPAPDGAGYIDRGPNWAANPDSFYIVVVDDKTRETTTVEVLRTGRVPAYVPAEEIARAYLDRAGLNGNPTQARFLSEVTDEDLAGEALRTWDKGQALVSPDELTEAFGSLLARYR